MLGRIGVSCFGALISGVLIIWGLQQIFFSPIILIFVTVLYVVALAFMSYEHFVDEKHYQSKEMFSGKQLDIRSTYRESFITGVLAPLYLFELSVQWVRTGEIY